MCFQDLKKKFFPLWKKMYKNWLYREVTMKIIGNVWLKSLRVEIKSWDVFVKHWTPGWVIQYPGQGHYVCVTIGVAWKCFTWRTRIIANTITVPCIGMKIQAWLTFVDRRTDKYKTICPLIIWSRLVEIVG